MVELEFRSLSELMVFTDNPYINHFRQDLDQIAPELWAHLSSVPALSSEAQQKVMGSFLALACECQNVLNIELGRAGLLALPREWLLGRLLNDAKYLLALDEEWEYLRLLEVASKLDETLFQTVLQRGLESSNPDVREAARDWLT